MDDLSPKKLEIAQMNRERLNELHYLALEKIDKMTRDNNTLLKLLDNLELYVRDVIIKTNRSDSMTPDDTSESMVMVTPSPKKTGLIRKGRNWSLDLTPKTPESPNILYRHLGKPSYRDQFIQQTLTPSRKNKGGKRGKNNRKNKTMRKYSKK